MKSTLLADLDLEYANLPAIIDKHMLPELPGSFIKDKIIDMKFNDERIKIILQKPFNGRSCGSYNETDSAYLIIVDPTLDYTIRKSEVMSRFIEINMEMLGFDSHELESYVRRFRESYLLREMNVSNV